MRSQQKEDHLESIGHGRVWILLLELKEFTAEF